MQPGERVANPRMKRAIRWAGLCGLLLVLFAGQALALGLGRIEVRSRAGEPLLAEIQVISGDPAELDALRARLASPDTFRRIGLPAPDAMLSELEFAVAMDVRGNPVIRVTTREPVTRPALTFLVEVDWGQGRLVREYSALIDTPQTVAAPSQPAIDAPVAAPSNTIVRGPAPAPTSAAPEEAGPGPAQGPVAVGDARQGSAGKDRAAAAPVPAPAAPRTVPAPPTAAAPAPAPGDRRVAAGETLGEIARQLVGDGIRREQAIVALFRANPEAFIANNLNLVREGAVLRIPDRSEIAGLDLGESRALMREQIAAWRAMGGPAPQPEAAALAGEGGSGPSADADPRSRAAASPVADARLEIVPPSAAGARQAGIRSGIQAGGEGEMLRQELQQELQQSRETLAASNAEVEELKARVADLERLQAQQARLIELKDSELAAAQERLATTGEAAAAAPETGSQGGGALPWSWIGLGLVLVAVVAWLLARRAPKPTPRPRFDSATLDAAAQAPWGAAGLSGAGEAAVADSAIEPGTTPSPQPAEVAEPGPAWHSRVAVPTGISVPPPAGEALHASTAAAGEDVAGSRSASSGTLQGGSERIELARAYLDLGDIDTARDLLREVAHAGDPVDRAEASRLLDGIA